MKMPWPITVEGPSRPMLFAYCTGVTPWRRTISWNSATLWDRWVVSGMARSSAAATESRNRSSVQVSIWAG